VALERLDLPFEALTDRQQRRDRLLETGLTGGKGL
jgi:hypothetical protein